MAESNCRSRGRYFWEYPELSKDKRIKRKKDLLKPVNRVRKWNDLFSFIRQFSDCRGFANSMKAAIPPVEKNKRRFIPDFDIAGGPVAGWLKI